MTDKVENLIILGAAGRDFHDFMTYWSLQSNIIVKCFTGAQIVSRRLYCRFAITYLIFNHKKITHFRCSLELMGDYFQQSCATMIRMGIDIPTD